MQRKAEKIRIWGITAKFIILFLIIAGILTLTQIKRHLFPGIDSGHILITTDYPGASPEEVEQDVTNKIEKELKNIADIKRMTSFSYENISYIRVEIDPNTENMGEIENRIREAVGWVTVLPAEVKEPPDIQHIKTSNLPIINIGIAGTGETGYQELKKLAQGFEKKLKEIPGVGRINRSGERGGESLMTGKVESPADRFFPRFNGKKVISFLVHKTESADIIRTVDAIKKFTESEEKILDQQVEFLYINDISQDLRTRLGVIRENVLVGFVLLIMVLTYFLSFRFAIWVVLSLPVALFGAIFFLPFFHVGLDVITLAAMIMTMCLILDNAIIISENILQRNEAGEPPPDAVVNGTRQVFPPVLITLVCTFAAFLPMLFIKGTIGKFIYIIPLSISLVLFISLLESIFLLPASLVSAFPSSESHDLNNPSSSLDKSKRYFTGKEWFKPLKQVFLQISYFSLKIRWLVVFLAVVGLVFAFIYMGNHINFYFLSPPMANNIHINLKLPTGDSLQSILLKVREIEKQIATLPKSQVQSFTARAKIYPGKHQDTSERENMVFFTVHLTPAAVRDRSAAEMMAVLKKATDQIQGIEKMTYKADTDVPSPGKPIVLQVVGADDHGRDKLAGDIVEFLNSLAMVKDIERDDKKQKSRYYHYNGQRAITITADILERKTTAMEVIRFVKSHFTPERNSKYPGVRLVIDREFREFKTQTKELLKNFGLAFLGIYLLLILLFRSIIQPILVFMTFIFVIIGIIIPLALHREPMTFAGLAGFTGLIMVVGNNILVLVSHLNRKSKENPGKDILEVVSEGTSDRLRPIMLTTISMLVFWLPLAYGIGGIDIHLAPMALVLGWGYLFTTPLPLILVPALYVIFRKRKKTSNFFTGTAKRE